MIKAVENLGRVSFAELSYRIESHKSLSMFPGPGRGGAVVKVSAPSRSPWNIVQHILLHS